MQSVVSVPTRLLREGILSSDRVDQLDAAAEVFYRRLMSKVDDLGLYDARPSILRSMLYPLRVDRVREADIPRWIATCEKAGLIALYVSDGKPLLQMLDTKWLVRSEPKWPLPPWGTATFTPVNNCKQLQTPVPVVEVVVEVVDVVSTLVDSPAAKSPLPAEKPKGKKNGHQVLGSRLPDDWRIPDEWKAWTIDAYPDVEPERVVRMSLEFRDFWIGVPGARGRKTNWLATWRNNVRKKMGDS